MTLKEDIIIKTREYHDTKFTFEKVSTIPTVNTKQLTFGCNGWQFDATVLYIDMRHSTKLLDEHKRSVVAKLHMSYYNAIVRIAKFSGGEIRSFNGDSLLVLFLGNDLNAVQNAVRTAFKMKYAISSIINPILKDYTDINFGIGIDLGNIVATKVGVRGDETTKDLIWLGDAVNKATKISDLCKTPTNIGVSSAIYNKLCKELKYFNDNEEQLKNVWETDTLLYNDNYETVYLSSCHIVFN